MKYCKVIIKPIVFLLLLFVLLGVISPYFQKNGDSISNYQKSRAVLSEAKDSVDILVLGDSLTYSTFIPMELWKTYGYTSYVSGFPARSCEDAIDVLEKALQKQHPTYVLLETNILFRDKRSLYYEAKKIFEEIAYPFTPVVIRHNAWKQLDLFNLQPVYEWQDPLKGYYMNELVSPYRGSAQQYSNDVKYVSEHNTKKANQIKALCDQYGAKLVMYSAPSMKNWSYAKRHGLEKLASDLHIPLLDTNVATTINIDWQKDTSDGGDHMNFFGATKVTSFLGTYFNQENTLTDKRKDPAYLSWNQDLEYYVTKQPAN